MEGLLSAGLGASAGDTAGNETTSGSAVKGLLVRQVVHAWSPRTCQMPLY